MKTLKHVLKTILPNTEFKLLVYMWLFLVFVVSLTLYTIVSI